MKTNEHHTAGCSMGDPCMDIPATGHYNTGHRVKGFTLVELIVVIAILGVLALFAIPAYSKYVEIAKISRSMSDIRSLESEINAYVIDKNALPASLVNIQRDTLLDAWKNPYVYRPVATAGALQRKDAGNLLNSDFDLYSLGPDGDSLPEISDPTSTSHDDIIRAADGGYVGTVANF